MAKKHGKKYVEVAKLVDRERAYPPNEAVDLVKRTAYAKFDGTVELHLRMGLDVRHADQQVRGTVALPAGTGKSVRVVAFATGDAAREAREAGADRVGGDDLIADIQGGWMEFDVAVAHMSLMPVVSRLGRILGPRGLMPNPRTGTATNDLGRAVREVKGGRIEFRTGRAPLIQVPIGKVSFSEDQILDNLRAMMSAVLAAKPSGAKGTYIRSLTLTSTMGPGIKLDLPAVSTLAAG